MQTLFTILIVIAAILLVLLVLIQNSKGGGLASGFQSGNQVMGAPKTTDFLEKATWSLIAFIAFFSILAVGFGKSSREATDNEVSVIEEEMTAASEAAQEAAPVDFAENAE